MDYFEQAMAASADVLAKSHHKATSRIVNGKVVQVKEFDDKRTKKAEPIGQEKPGKIDPNQAEIDAAKPYADKDPRLVRAIKEANAAQNLLRRCKPGSVPYKKAEKRLEAAHAQIRSHTAGAAPDPDTSRALINPTQEELQRQAAKAGKKAARDKQVSGYPKETKAKIEAMEQIAAHYQELLNDPDMAPLHAEAEQALALVQKHLAMVKKYPPARTKEVEAKVKALTTMNAHLQEILDNPEARDLHADASQALELNKRQLALLSGLHHGAQGPKTAPQEHFFDGEDPALTDPADKPGNEPQEAPAKPAAKPKGPKPTVKPKDSGKPPAKKPAAKRKPPAGDQPAGPTPQVPGKPAPAPAPPADEPVEIVPPTPRPPGTPIPKPGKPSKPAKAPATPLDKAAKRLAKVKERVNDRQAAANPTDGGALGKIVDALHKVSDGLEEAYFDGKGRSPTAFQDAIMGLIEAKKSGDKAAAVAALRKVDAEHAALTGGKADGSFMNKILNDLGFRHDAPAPATPRKPKETGNA